MVDSNEDYNYIDREVYNKSLEILKEYRKLYKISHSLTELNSLLNQLAYNAYDFKDRKSVV